MALLQRVGMWVVVALLATVTAAQMGPGQMGPAQMGPATGAPTHRSGSFVQILRLAQHLNLTEEQRPQLHALLESAQQQAKVIRQDATLSADQKRDQVRQIVHQARMDFAALLTPEQRARLVHFANAPGPLASLARLNPTDAQKAEVKAIFQKQRESVRSVRQNTSLAPEQKQQQIRQIREDTHKQFLDLLTPEQLKLWEQMHPRRGMPNSGAPGR